MVFERSDQLLLNKFFDPSPPIPFMRTSKIQNGHQGAPRWPMGYRKGRSLQLSLNKFFDPSPPIPSIRASKLQNGRQGAPKWLMGSGKGRSRQLLLNNFIDPSTPSMRKGYDGEEKNSANSGPLLSCQSTA